VWLVSSAPAKMARGEGGAVIGDVRPDAFKFCASVTATIYKFDCYTWGCQCLILL